MLKTRRLEGVGGLWVQEVSGPGRLVCFSRDKNRGFSYQMLVKLR